MLFLFLLTPISTSWRSTGRPAAFSDQLCPGQSIPAVSNYYLPFWCLLTILNSVCFFAFIDNAIFVYVHNMSLIRSVFQYVYICISLVLKIFLRDVNHVTVIRWVQSKNPVMIEPVNVNVVQMLSDVNVINVDLHILIWLLQWVVNHVIVIFMVLKVVNVIKMVNAFVNLLLLEWTVNNAKWDLFDELF